MNLARVKAVVVGAGLMGWWHARAIRRSGGTITGVIDSDALRAAQLAKECGGASTYVDLSSALDAQPPDVVHVCTPLASHVALIREALERRCHVLAEKPIAASAGDTQLLLGLALSQRRLLVPVHQFPFQQGVLDLLARRGELGPLLHLDVSLASAGAQGTAFDADSVVADFLPHCLALTRAVLGVPLRNARWRVAKGRAGEWRVQGEILGRSVTYLISMATRPTFAEMRVLGERASAFVDLFHGYSVIDSERVSRASKAARPFRVAGKSLFAASSNLARRALRAEPAYPGLNELVRQTHRAVRDQAPTPIPPDEVLDIAVVRDLLIAMSEKDTPW